MPTPACSQVGKESLTPIVPRSWIVPILIALSAMPHGIGATSPSELLYVEDFEDGATGWQMPSYWGTTEGCLGAAEGVRSLQIANCGSSVPWVSSLGTVSHVGRVEITKPYALSDVSIEYALRATDDLTATAYLDVIGSCGDAWTLRQSWRVGPDLPTGLDDPAPYTPATTSWTSAGGVMPPCTGTRVSVSLLLHYPHPTLPAEDLFAIDAIVVRAS